MIQFFPRCDTLGTSEKLYTTSTADRTNYTNTTELCPDDYTPNSFDLQKAKKGGLEYLLKPLEAVQLKFATRGKQMVFGIKHVSSVLITPNI